MTPLTSALTLQGRARRNALAATRTLHQHRLAQEQADLAVRAAEQAVVGDEGEPG